MGKGKPAVLKMRSASYDPESRKVTLVSAKSVPSRRTFSAVISNLGDLAGNPLAAGNYAIGGKA